MELFFRGHLFNNWLKDKKSRRKKRKTVQTEIYTKYFKRYLPSEEALPEGTAVIDDENEKIFSIWLQGEDDAPDIIKACYRSIRQHCKQELVVLDENSIFDYVELPETIVQKYKSGIIGRAHFSDICRVELLYRHGGFWLDSTAFLTAPIPQWMVDQDFFVYLTGDGWEILGSPYSFMQNCYIRARRGSYLLSAWRAMILNFWMHENKKCTYFMHQIMFRCLVLNDERAKKYFELMPHVIQNPTHALWYAHRDERFDQEKFNELTSGSFFQKLSHHGSRNYVKGSFSDVLINGTSPMDSRP